jgi:transcriptional regulator with XRE-family HTH domain
MQSHATVTVLHLKIQPQKSTNVSPSFEMIANCRYYTFCNILKAMNGRDLLSGREQKGWTQQEAAARLGVSQPYLSLLEKEVRRVPERLARKAASTFRLSAVTLPPQAGWQTVQHKTEEALAADLAALGYPGFSHLKARRKKNPAEVLLAALSAHDLNSRLTEALPWVLLEYPDLDWNPLLREVKVRDLQNRLGFVTAVARQVAEKQGDKKKAEWLRSKEAALAKSRLFVEDTLCHDSLTKSERQWLNTARSKDAKYWRLLTDLKPEHLSYASTTS